MKALLLALLLLLSTNAFAMEAWEEMDLKMKFDKIDDLEYDVWRLEQTVEELKKKMKTCCDKQTNPVR